MANQMSPGLGEKIRMARLRKGWSGEQLGRAIGKTQAFISSLENSKRQPSLGTLRDIAAALGRPLHYFLEESPLDDRASIPRRLEDACKAQGMSYAQLAAASGVPTVTIHRILRGYVPDQEVLRKLANALRLSVTELAGYLPDPQAEVRLRELMSDPRLQQAVYRFTEQFPNSEASKSSLVRLLEEAIQAHQKARTVPDSKAASERR